MSIFIPILILFLSLSINFVIIYFFYKKFKKYFIKIFEFIKTLDNKPKLTPKLPVKDHFQQELDKINDLLKKNTKK